MVGSGLQVFLVESDIFGWTCLQATGCLEKGRDRPKQDTQMCDFVEEGGAGTSTVVDTS